MVVRYFVTYGLIFDLLVLLELPYILLSEFFTTKPAMSFSIFEEKKAFF